MIPSHDARWKIAHIPTVVLPFRMPNPLAITARDLARVGVHISGGWVEVTETCETPEQALKDGQDMKKVYERQDPWGNHAEVVAIIEWKDELVYSAAVSKYHSDS